MIFAYLSIIYIYVCANTVSVFKHFIHVILCFLLLLVIFLEISGYKIRAICTYIYFKAYSSRTRCTSFTMVLFLIHTIDNVYVL